MEGRTPFQAAEAGDKTALTVCRQYTEELAEGIISIVNLLRPEAVAVGGGCGPARRTICCWSLCGGWWRRGAIPATAAGVTRILRAELGNDAGIIGAALLSRVI